MSSPDATGREPRQTLGAWMWSTRARKVRTVVLGGVIVLLIGAIILAVQLLIARQHLLAAVPLVSELQAAVIAGDVPTAQRVANEAADAVGAAAGATGGPVWDAAQAVWGVGDDLAAVRTTAVALDEFVKNGLIPLAGIDVKSVGPTNGAFNLAAFAPMEQPLAEAASAAQRAQARMSVIDEKSLLPPVMSAIDQFASKLNEYTPFLVAGEGLVKVLPDALGASGPRDYIVLVQNNAEARSTGGNPGASMLMRAEAGRLSIVQQAGTQDFNTRRQASILSLAQPTEDLYSDRVGKFIQDITMPVWFQESGDLARAFWSEIYGGPPHAVLAIDAVTLSYLLKATGPVAVPGGELRPENAVDELLNGVYFTYPDYRMQDAYFAAVAANVFAKITSSGVSLGSLMAQLGQAASEGRILYSPVVGAEADLIAGSNLTGPLPETNNRNKTAVGVFVNDNTEGKLDYYANMSLDVASDVCEASETPAVAMKATYNYTLMPDQVANLPVYISTGVYFPKGVKSTNLIFYGPVGAQFESATIDGQPYVPPAGVEDHGRPAVRILFESQPGQSHTVLVRFTGAAGDTYGPLEVRHTPLIDPVPVTVDAPGCG